MIFEKHATKQIKITLIRSLAGQLPNHKACANGLGLRRIGQAVTVENNPCNVGMIHKAAHLLRIEAVHADA